MARSQKGLKKALIPEIQPLYAKTFIVLKLILFGTNQKMA